MKYTNKNFISTGIEGLDNVLAGGFPAGRLYLVEGEPGAGKTTLAMQFLLAGKADGNNCLYITLSESTEELRAVAESHGWDLSGLELYELPLDVQLATDSQNTFFHSSELELGETNEALIKVIERVQPKRIVIDSLTELKLMAQNARKFRRQILSLKNYFSQRGITVLLLDDKTSSISDQEVQSIVHGVLHLEQLAPEYGAERRRLSLAKLRGVSYRGGYHDFIIRKGGLVVFPRLIASEHGIESNQLSLSSGVDGIDALMGGGIERGSNTLIMGPAGCGKSSLAFQYAIHAASTGEHATVFTFDEGKRTAISRSEGIGMDVENTLKSGKLDILQIDPSQVSPGEFASMVRAAVEQKHSKVIVIDSLNGYMNAMPEERFLILQMHEILSFLSQMGVVTFIIVVQHGLLGTSMETNVDISYLADNVFLLRYFEHAGEVNQALSVVKKRAGAHERTIRKLQFSEKGILVGHPLVEFHGVLSGIPQYQSTGRSMNE